jgi:hypothetical protein
MRTSVYRNLGASVHLRVRITNNVDRWLARLFTLIKRPRDHDELVTVGRRILAAESA